MDTPSEDLASRTPSKHDLKMVLTEVEQAAMVAEYVKADTLSVLRKTREEHFPSTGNYRLQALLALSGHAAGLTLSPNGDMAVHVPSVLRDALAFS